MILIDCYEVTKKNLSGFKVGSLLCEEKSKNCHRDVITIMHS